VELDRILGLVLQAVTSACNALASSGPDIEGPAADVLLRTVELAHVGLGEAVSILRRRDRARRALRRKAALP
jgi:hypothetical protein